MPHPFTLQPLPFPNPAAPHIPTRRDLTFPAADGTPRAFDLTLPIAPTSPPPVVLLVGGYPDEGFRAFFGCSFREMAAIDGWARLLAASGIAAIAYEGRDPLGDLRALLEHLRGRADELGVDGDRLGLWASSGNVPVALAPLLDRAPGIRAAAFLYGYLLDQEDETAVADAAARFHFVHPNVGRTVAELPRGLPLLLVRAGADATPGLNAGLDRFVAAALAADLSLALVNLPAAAHAFDLGDDRPAARAVIRQVLGFLRANLLDPADLRPSPPDR